MADNTLQSLLEHHATFLSFIQRRVADRALAEDILQNAYIRAMQRSNTIRDEGSTVGWFYSVLRNAVIDHIRSRASENKALERWAAELGGNQETPADPFTHGLVCHCVEKLLPTLPPQYASILREVELAETPLREYAEKNGLSSGNAAVRAHRARAALKRELTRVCGVCSYHACLDCTCKAHAAELAKQNP